MKKKQILTSLAELKIGDFMVHLDFGVGLYRGLEHIELAGIHSGDSACVLPPVSIPVR